MEEIICWAFCCGVEHCNHEGLGQHFEVDEEGDFICPRCGMGSEDTVHVAITRSGLMNLDLDTVIRLKEKINSVLEEKMSERGDVCDEP